MDFIRTDLIDFNDYLGLKYAVPWKSGKYYTRGDYVRRIEKDRFGNYACKRYVCATSHTSGSAFDSTKFAPFLRDNRDKGFWNSWEDWHLIPSSRPVFASPKKRERTVVIPGADGVLNLSNISPKGAIYEDSEGSFEFIVDNDWENWETVYSKIMNVMHGMPMRCILEDDQGYYHEGDFSVNKWLSEETNSQIVIDYKTHPYKYGITASDEDAYWDPIIFETDIIRDHSNIIISGNNVVYTRRDNSTFTRSYLDFYCGRKYSTGVVRCLAADNLTLTIRRVSKTIFGQDAEETVYTKLLSANTDYYFDFSYEHYRFYFSGTPGNGRISIQYREGSL